MVSSSPMVSQNERPYSGTHGQPNRLRNRSASTDLPVLSAP
jgi:hypothetical protein